MNGRSLRPLWPALALFWLISIVLLGAALARTGGHLIYPLDDTYIHMAIARHLVTDGHWAVTPNSFTSSTSSPLWTLLIALMYCLLGVNDWAPVVLGLICGTFAILLCYSLLRSRLSPLRLLLLLPLIVLLVPLPVLALTGMEHALHGLLTLWLVYSATTLLCEKKPTKRQVGVVLVLSALVPVVRYEGLFLVLVIIVLLLVSKRALLALATGVVGVLPALAYGLFSLSKGWYLLPNSVLMKGNVPAASLAGLAAFLNHLLENMGKAPHVLMILVAGISVYLWRAKDDASRSRSRTLILTLVMTALLHMQFAETGWFYRYEAYLVLVGITILVEMVGSKTAYDATSTGGGGRIDVALGVTLAILVMLPLAVRAGKAVRDYPLAAGNIHEQQYQMGQFVKLHYQEKGVAANDIGAVSYLSDARLLDLFGLASMEVASAKRAGQFDKQAISELLQDHPVGIVMIYSSWFEGEVPDEWIEVGRWRIADNVVCAADTVTFYSPNRLLLQDAVDSLSDFSDLLPATVMQSGLYTTP